MGPFRDGDVYKRQELGLSEGAVRGLVTGAVDVQILNRLLEHRNFPKLIDLIRIYFQDTAAKGITTRTVSYTHLRPIWKTGGAALPIISARMQFVHSQ